MNKIRMRLTEQEVSMIKQMRAQLDTERVLIIGDLHAPFIKRGYLGHCKEVAAKYDVNRIILIGDVIDNHYSSFHATDPDGLGAGDELQQATDMLAPWIEAFPVADVLLGNHDRIIQRKAFESGVSSKWIKGYSEMLGAPDWNFSLSVESNGVLYLHGEGGGGINGALQKALNKRMSIVQGHFHTEAHIRWNVSQFDRQFAMQVGCGIDDESYALAYAKYNTKKSIISCAVVLDDGELPILEPMRL